MYIKSHGTLKSVTTFRSTGLWLPPPKNYYWTKDDIHNQISQAWTVASESSIPLLGCQKILKLAHNMFLKWRLVGIKKALAANWQKLLGQY